MSNIENTEGNNFTIAPYLTVTDVDRAAQFYEKAFQFRILEVKSGDNGKGIHSEMAYKNQLVMCGREGAYENPLKAPCTSGIESPITLCVYCDDVDDFYRQAVAEGAESISAPENTFWGYRMCRLQDPDGYTWCFMAPL